MTFRRAIVPAFLIAWVLQFFAAPALYASSPPRIVPAQVVMPHPNVRRPTVCTEQYLPVCARFGGILKTHSNQCFARAAGAKVIADGPCTSKSTSPSPN